MLKVAFIIALLICSTCTARAQVVKQLIGKYQMEAASGEVLELRANGTASLGGEETRWSANGTTLRVSDDTMPYALLGGRLILSISGLQIPWRRTGVQAAQTQGQPPSPSQTPKGRPGDGGAASRNIISGTMQDQQARQILMQSAWCSFTYNKVSGTSTTRRVVFRPVGVMTVNGGAETYSSGYGGTYSGQSNSGGAARWRYENQRLYLDQASGFQDIGMQATTNSNGYIILHADGREYSMCQ